MIKSERYPSWNVNANEMREMLGLKYGAQLPFDGLPSRQIQGWRVWVEAYVPGRGTSKVHRVRAECPMCKQTMSAGRTHQHKCITPRKLAKGLVGIG